MKEISLREVFEKMDPSTHQKIIDVAKSYEATHLAVYECIQMDSSSFGNRSVICVGPNNTIKTPEELAKSIHKPETVSQREYPQAYAVFDAEEAEVIIKK